MIHVFCGFAELLLRLKSSLTENWFATYRGSCTPRSLVLTPQGSWTFNAGDCVERELWVSTITKVIRSIVPTTTVDKGFDESEPGTDPALPADVSEVVPSAPMPEPMPEEPRSNFVELETTFRGFQPRHLALTDSVLTMCKFGKNGATKSCQVYPRTESGFGQDLFFEVRWVAYVLFFCFVDF